MVKRKRERVKTYIYIQKIGVTIFSEIYIQWKKEETDFIVPKDKFIPFLLLYSLVHVQVCIVIVFLEDQKVRSTEINYFKGMYWYPTDLYKVFTRWNLNFLCYGYQWSFAKHNTPLLGIQRGRCKFWPTEKQFWAFWAYTMYDFFLIYINLLIQSLD